MQVVELTEALPKSISNTLESKNIRYNILAKFGIVVLWKEAKLEAEAYAKCWKNLLKITKK